MLHYDVYHIDVFDVCFIRIIISHARGNMNRCNSSKTELLSSLFRSINFDLDLKRLAGIDLNLKMQFACISPIKIFVAWLGSISEHKQIMKYYQLTHNLTYIMHH